MRRKHSAPRLALRFAVALALLLALSLSFSKPLTQALLPVMRWEIAQLDANYRVLDLQLTEKTADRVLQLDVGLAQYVLIGGQALYPDPRARAQVTTLAGQIFQPLVLCWLLILAWPVRRAREYSMRVLVGVCVSALIVLLDVPFVLWGELWSLQATALEPGRLSPLLVWKDFLQGGGRFVLGLAGGLLALAAARAMFPSPPQPAPAGVAA